MSNGLETKVEISETKPCQKLKSNNLKPDLHKTEKFMRELIQNNLKMNDSKVNSITNQILYYK